jgi:hypothetical protein
LQFTQGHGGEAGVDLKREGVGSAGLAMGQPRELLAVAEQKFDLEAGRVIAVEGHGVEVQRGAEQEGDPLGSPVTDDDHPDPAAEPGEVDDGGFEEEVRVGGGHAAKHRRVPVDPIDLAGVAAGGATPGVGAGIEVTRIGIAPEFADEVQV